MALARSGRAPLLARLLPPPNGADETRRSRKKDGAMGGRDETNEGGESAVMG